jgi:anthranilate/para-aminobenzoate synthase component I
MAQNRFSFRTAGPFTVCLKAIEGCPDLAGVIQALPDTMPVVWLDSARVHRATGRYSMVGYDPWLALLARGDRIELSSGQSRQVFRAHPLEALRAVLHRYAVPSRALGSAGRGLGLMGWLSYELSRWIEPRLQRAAAPSADATSTIPMMAWFGMKVVIIVDHFTGRSWVMSVADPDRPSGPARRAAREVLEEAVARVQAAGWQRSEAHEVAQWPPEIAERFRGLSPGPPILLSQESRGVTGPSGPVAEASIGTEVPLQPTSSRAEFEAMVERALEHIRAGEIFQANVSQRFTGPWEGSARALSLTLRRVNPSPFATFVSIGDLAVVSCSPERLVSVEAGRMSTRPIAGTRPRGVSPEEETLNSLELLLSEKERAEHLMLVDLERNDLGRVCETGTVSVNELMALEAYSHVIHIVSEISGRLRRGVDAVDVIRAVFPGGTITGCPKVRCMELLQAMEPVARGLYTGSLGYLAFDGAMDLNIAIRTILLQRGMASLHVGAGIVADSDPSREYQETLQKAAAMFQALRQWPIPRCGSGSLGEDPEARGRGSGKVAQWPQEVPGFPLTHA